MKTGSQKSWLDARVVGLAWLNFSVANACQVYLSMFDHGHSFPRILLFNLVVWGLWAAITPLVVGLARRYPILPWRVRTLLQHLGVAVLVAILHSAAWTQLTVWMQPYDAMSIDRFAGNFLPSLGLRLNLELMLYAIVVGLATALDTRERLHARELETELLRSQLTAARLHALELQLKPHFLFNTLHTLNGLMRAGDTAMAIEMVVRLGDLLQQTLSRGDRPLISLERELELLRAYWKIEEVRFADRLTLDLDIDAAALSSDQPNLAVQVPTLLLQPLAENAIRHGIAKIAGPATLRLRVRREGDQVAVEMFNSGPPLAAARREGVGLSNCRERLRQLYGDAAELTLANVEGGVCVSLRWPMTAPHGQE